MRKISMKRKSKTLNSDVPEEEKSDDGADSSQEQDVEDSPSKKSKKNKRASKANEENGTDKKKKNDVSDDEEEEDEPEEEEPKKGKKSKRASKANEENGTDKKGKHTDANDDEEEYEVEKVVGDKMVRGTRHYLIRWKGHDEDADTWEPENTLNCDDLINDYMSTKGAKSPKSKKGRPGKESPKKKSQTNDDDDEEREEIYEVDKIIDVYFKKNGHREFLVHWKGYSPNDNTWEPEEHMNCPELIERFMAKVEKAKAVETKELRVKRKPTDRFTVLMEQSGRKLSRRNLGKQRVHYFDAE